MSVEVASASSAVTVGALETDDAASSPSVVELTSGSEALLSSVLPQRLQSRGIVEHDGTTTVNPAGSAAHEASYDRRYPTASYTRAFYGSCTENEATSQIVRCSSGDEYARFDNCSC